MKSEGDGGGNESGVSAYQKEDTGLTKYRRQIRVSLFRSV